jgi:hypothetical protein
MRNSATPLSSWRLFDEMYAYIRRISKEILYVQYGARNISLSQKTEKRPAETDRLKVPRSLGTPAGQTVLQLPEIRISRGLHLD